MARVEDRLYQDAALAQFYDLENGWAADFDFCLRQAEKAHSVLDLGCGTGELAAALAKERRVVGVDPAEAMLAIARSRAGGERVSWHFGDACSLDLDERFDLVLLTGHAFQVFLTEADQRAVLQTIARHLATDGRFLFDSRNPAAEAWRSWTPERSARRLEHPTLGAIEAWNDVAYDAATGIATYQTFYRVAETAALLSGDSQIRFTPQADLARRLEESGLTVVQWLGDWQGGPYHDTAAEVIALEGLRRAVDA